ncbi:MAG: hypothetical protein EOP09_19720 [Proteobacteria bacterium]|nr:MAG: hypothetical protein EOP09_19720 [Pseudomonadota bacterium]
MSPTDSLEIERLKRILRPLEPSEPDLQDGEQLSRRLSGKAWSVLLKCEHVPLKIQALMLKSMEQDENWTLWTAAHSVSKAQFEGLLEFLRNRLNKVSDQCQAEI